MYAGSTICAHPLTSAQIIASILQVLEQIMFRYVDLCVELKKGRYAKDGLIHYRNVCQQVNVSSLEEVIKYFLKTATNKAEAAQSKAAEVGLLLSLPATCWSLCQDTEIS